MFILKKGHQPGVYVPLRALFLVPSASCGGFSSQYSKSVIKNITTMAAIFFLDFYMFIKNRIFAVGNIFCKS